MAYLAVFAFDECEAYPTRRDIGAITDRRDAFPKVFRSLKDFRLARLGSVAFDGYTLFQLVYSLLRDLPIHLGEIGARMLESRVEQPFDEPSVVGEEQSPSLSWSSRPAAYTLGGKPNSSSARCPPSGVNWLSTPKGLLKRITMVPKRHFSRKNRLFCFTWEKRVLLQREFCHAKSCYDI